MEEDSFLSFILVFCILFKHSDNWQAHVNVATNFIVA
jgi:low affinity Fe/Cu permease